METNNELLVEKQKTKTEKVKQGKGKMVLGTGLAILFLAACTICATWVLSIFMPEAVERAISVFIR